MADSGLSNDDFRRIAATPRRVDLEDESGSASGAAKGKYSFGFARPHVGAKPAKSRGFKKPSAAGKSASKPKAASADPDAIKYRDRAEERRSGKTDDDEANPAGLTKEEIEALPEHMSKYLGGSVHHSHLVKGLDFLLLQRSKEAIQKEEELRLEQEYQARVGQVAATAAVAAESAAKVELDRQAELHLGQVQGANAMSRNLLAKLKQESTSGRFRPSELLLASFLPGRMVYEFDTDALAPASALPTILRRSREDCPEPVLRKTLTLPGALLAQLNTVLDLARSGTKPREIRPAIVAAPAPPPRAVSAADSDDDDIFGDAGDDYVCEPTIPASAIRPVDSTSYFAEPVQPETVIPQDVSSASGVDDPTSMRIALRQAKEAAGMVGIFEPIDRRHASDDAAASNLRRLQSLIDVDAYGADMYDDDDDDDGRATKPVEPAAAKPTARMAAGKRDRQKVKDKAKLNTQWQQISTLIDKRKEAASAASDSATKRTRTD